MKTDITVVEWQKIKNQGILKYITFQWIIPIALPLSFFLPLLRAILQMDFKPFLNTFIINFCIFCLVSVLFGIRKWRKYTKLFD